MDQSETPLGLMLKFDDTCRQPQKVTYIDNYYMQRQDLNLKAWD